ncbi:MAG: hypothetical protein JJE39_01530 [Vicinamibacteria bacterium]|nr:hypothetical protein [Vicinamibacteria bacterium]
MTPLAEAVVLVAALALLLLGATLSWFCFKAWPYLREAKKWGLVFRGALGDSSDAPMSASHYDVYRRLKHLGAWAVEEGLVSRLLLVETSPGVQRAVFDVSSRGQFAFLLSHMRQHASIAEDERIVIDLGANDGFQGSHSCNFTQLGWWAVLVEANPALEAELRNNAGRDKRWLGHEDRVIIRISAVTGRTDGPQTLNIKGWAHTGSSLLAPSGAPGEFGVSVRGESAETLMLSIEESLTSRGAALPRTFGVLSLDIEGLDLEVLSAVCHAGFRPRYIVSEARGDLSPYERLLYPLGYRRLAYFDADLIYWMPPARRGGPDES